MKARPSFNSRRLAFTAVLVLVVITALLVWAQDVVREVIVLPLSYLLYAVRLFTISTPEWYFWALLLVIVAMMTFRSLSAKRGPLAPPPTQLNELAYAPSASGRVSYWGDKVALMRQGASRYYITNFHNTYGRLLLTVLSHRYRTTLRDVEARLQDGTLGVPEDVREYALFTLQRQEARPSGFLQGLWQDIVQALRRLYASRAATTGPSAADDPRVIAILKYIEDELEVKHDDSGR